MSSGTTQTQTRPTPIPITDWQKAIGLHDDWSPSRVNFSEWHGRYKHPSDYDDVFYQANYKALYETMRDFAEKWFGGDIYLEDYRDTEAKISTWEVPMTDQFVQYASGVAHEDRDYIAWSEILNDPAHRKWLCLGILSQIIERKIWNQLLFGASPYYQHELDRHDLQWVAAEGKQDICPPLTTKKT
jgi:hypothetical protein